MKALRLFSIFTLVASFVTHSLLSQAFTRSEDELMAAEIAVARARANDFKATRERMKREEIEREKFAQEAKIAREEVEWAQEDARRRFIEERNSRPDVEAETARLEQLDLEQKQKEEARMEQARREYIAKRQKVKRIIEEEAYIDEALEYDVTQPPTENKN